jgi:hypothetical protein
VFAVSGARARNQVSAVKIRATTAMSKALVA